VTTAEDLAVTAIAAAQVANFCDHADHNEPSEPSWVTGAGATLRRVAERIAVRTGINLLAAYGDRLGAVESRSTHDGFNGPAAALAATTWRDLQQVQEEHDRVYHPDVFGTRKSDQLNHYALHLCKLVGALGLTLTDEGELDDFRSRRLPDMLLFGIKLATVMGQKLPDEPLPESLSVGREVVAA
jgi:hypothetical protein